MDLNNVMSDTSHSHFLFTLDHWIVPTTISMASSYWVDSKIGSRKIERALAG